jgi:hypothetical protein
MFLIPFIYKKTESIYQTHIFHIFLNKGTLFLQINKSEIDSFCKENEIYYSKKKIQGNKCFLEIDLLKTKIEDFYSYFENSEAECWRRFVLVGNSTEDFLHINSTNPDFIEPILNEISDIVNII